ncbi:UNVERIFIED_ORG: hypothetical protein B2H95_05655 [Clostridium botulinum]|uniref:hypothetical protein n=1 Tax=Clostridium sp. ZBS15 TaxID=2949969 RepID=UPI000A17488F|nr:hypothetical protein [Clostridium sp. ZBS15]
MIVMDGVVVLEDKIKEFKSMLLESIKDEKILISIKNSLNNIKNIDKFVNSEENKNEVNNELQKDYKEKYEMLELEYKKLLEKLEIVKQKNKIFKEENNQLLDELEKTKKLYTDQIQELEKEHKLKLIEYESKQNEILLINGKLQNELLDLNNQFKDIRVAYHIYIELEENIKNQLDGIFKGRNIEKFLYCGIQYKSIEALWEYMKILSINGQIKSLDKLNNIFKNLINAYNNIYERPLYKIQEVNIGELFDEDKFIRGYNSKINGNIQEVYIKGYINLNTNNIVKKSVVRV